MSGVNLKIERSKIHLEQIDEELRRQGEFGTETIDAVTSEDGLITTYIARHTPVIDRMFPAIIGDLVHNLRSALDHLAWQLVLANGGTPTPNTFFPIKSVRSGLANIDGGIDASAASIIEGVQPYGGTSTGRSLELLRNISNVDKHRTLTLTWAAVHEIVESYATAADDQGQSGPAWRLTGNPIEDGAVVAIAIYPSAERGGRTVNFGAFLMISAPPLENGLITIGSLYGLALDVETLINDLAIFVR
jgi:hypothetical protein